MQNYLKNECAKLLEKEIKFLEFNLERAKNKSGVQPDEIANIEKKLELKREILKILLEG